MAMPSALDAAKKKYGEENPNRPPKVDPKYMKEEVYSTGGKEHTHKTHTETYNSAERTTKIEDRIEEPNTKTEKIRVKNGRVTEHEVHQKRYNENTQTMEETHGVFEDAPKQININRTIRNGRTIKEEVDKTLYDAETGADVHLHDVHEEVTAERDVDYEVIEGRVVKTNETRTYYDNTKGEMVKERIAESHPPIESNTEIHSIDGVPVEVVRNEKRYLPERNEWANVRAVNQFRLGCGHVAQKGGAMYECSICGKTLCGSDECGAIVNGQVFCSEHIMAARNMGQLYR